MAEAKGRTGEAELTALLVAPDRELASRLLATLAEARSFQVLAELKSYPTLQTLEIRLRQLRPDVVLLDVASDGEAAAQLIRFLASWRPQTLVVGLAPAHEPEMVLRTLRLGASEFLAAPFAAGEQREAVARLRRLKAPEAGARAAGKVAVFAAAKPGAGASTLAAQTALALRRQTGGRVLVADLDPEGASLAFYLKLDPPATIADALERGGVFEPASWAALVGSCHGVEVLAGPSEPGAETVEPSRLYDLIEFARQLYDWVVLDAPAVPHRTTLVALSASDRAFLVSTPELASLHLAHRTVGLLGQLGFGRDRFEVIINRWSKRNGVGAEEIRRMLAHPVAALLPEDPLALHQAVSLGQAVAAERELGRALERLARRLAAEEAERAHAGAGTA